jgi:phage FluMu protein Com
MSEKATKPGAGYSVRCVHCQAVLKSPVPVPGGKTIKCPKCKQSFTTPADGATKVEGQTALKRPAALTSANGPLDDDAEMAAAIAKLQGDGGLGAPAASPPKPAQAASPAPTTDSLDDDDEMAAAIAKLQGDGGLGASAPPPSAPPAKSEPAIPDMEIPEVDDDLVVPNEDDEPTPEEDVDEDFEMEVVDDDEEEPAAKKRRKRHKEDDATRSKKKSRRDDAEDEDKPRSKKKSNRDDEEENEDEPRSRKKVRRSDDDEENEHEEPRSKKKSKRDDEENEDSPRSRNKGNRDDDDENDEPRSKKKQKKKAGSPLMLIGLIGGGILALLLCTGCGIGGFLLIARPGDPEKEIVGKWQFERDVGFHRSIEPPPTLQFNQDGSLEVYPQDPAALTGKGTWKTISKDGNSIKVDVTYTFAAKNFSQTRKQTWTFVVVGHQELHKPSFDVVVNGEHRVIDDSGQRYKRI